MKRAFFLLVLSALLAACSNREGDQISVENDSKETPNFGSATDIASADGSSRTTNSLNAADNGLGGPAQREAGNYQRQPPGQSSDQELTKQIKVALTTGSTGTTGVIAENQLTRIDVQVRNGVVTLTGPAANESEKRTIEKQVLGMKGVRSVVNNLTVGARTLEDSPTKAFVPRSPQN